MPRAVNMERVDDRMAAFSEYLGTLSNEQVGKLFRLYFEGAEDTQWEGFSNPDRAGIAKMLVDMRRASRYMEI